MSLARPAGKTAGEIVDILLEGVVIEVDVEVDTAGMAFAAVDTRRDRTFDRFTILRAGTGIGGCCKSKFGVLGVDKTRDSFSSREDIEAVEKCFVSLLEVVLEYGSAEVIQISNRTSLLYAELTVIVI